MIGSCPEAGRPRIFGNTIFEFDMITYYKKTDAVGIRYYR